MLNIFAGAFNNRDPMKHLKGMQTQINNDVQKIDECLNKSKTVIARFEAERKENAKQIKLKSDRSHLHP